MSSTETPDNQQSAPNLDSDLESFAVAINEASLLLADAISDTILRLKHGIRTEDPNTLLQTLITDLPPWAETQGFSGAVVSASLEQLQKFPSMEERNNEAIKIWAYLVVHAANK